MTAASKQHLPHETAICLQIVLILGKFLVSLLFGHSDHFVATAEGCSAGAGHIAGSWGRPGRLLGRTTEAPGLKLIA